jgi:undecaprenyl-diphosphatase
LDFIFQYILLLIFYRFDIYICFVIKAKVYMDKTMQTDFLSQKQLSYSKVNRVRWVVYFFGMALWLCLAEWREWVPVLDLLDKRLTLMLNFNGSAVTDHFWYGYSQLWVWLPFVGIVLIEMWRNCESRIRGFIVFILATALLIVVLDQISSTVIKPWVGRLRPSHDPAISTMLHYVNDYRGGLYGFVSGHATNVVGLSTWLGLAFRNYRTRFTLGLFSALMCYSRIYLGVHYLGDVLCGALLGYCIARIAFHYLRTYMDICVTSRYPYSISIAYSISACLILMIP